MFIMENNTGQNGRNIRREQRQQKVPYNRHYGEDYKQTADQEIEKEKESVQSENPNTKIENCQMPFGLNLDILKNLDSDKMLIIALLAMIYKDGGNKKLMMALAYLLT